MNKENYLSALLVLTSIAVHSEEPLPQPKPSTMFDSMQNYAGQTFDVTKKYIDKTVDATKQYTGQATTVATQYTNTATEWAKEDLSKAGKWRYKVATISSPANLQEQLDKLGDEKWECGELKEVKGETVLICKQPEMSYVAGTIHAIQGLAVGTKQIRK